VLAVASGRELNCRPILADGLRANSPYAANATGKWWYATSQAALGLHEAASSDVSELCPHHAWFLKLVLRSREELDVSGLVSATNGSRS